MTGKTPSEKAKTKTKKPASSKPDADADKEPNSKKAPKADRETGGVYDSLAERFGSLNPPRTAETGPDGELIELPDAVDGEGSVVASTPRAGTDGGSDRVKNALMLSAAAFLGMGACMYIGKRYRKAYWDI